MTKQSTCGRGFRVLALFDSKTGIPSTPVAKLQS